MFEEAKKFMKKAMDFDHDCHNSEDDACQGCHSITAIIDGLEKDERELSAAFTAIRQYAVEMDTDWPVDYHGHCKKIIAIIDSIDGRKESDGSNTKS